MRKIIIRIISVACYLGSLTLTSSCAGFEDINTDPNKISYGNTNPTKLLQDIIYSGHWTVFYRSVSLNSELMQYSVYVSSVNRTSYYEIKANDPLQLWRGLWRWVSAAHHMYTIAEAQDDGNSMAIALTLKIYLMEYLTAIFGDVPYSEALRWGEGEHLPRYDLQKDIYESMLWELDMANSLYNTSKSLDFPERDLLYKGNISKWQKFTNSLHMRLLMRVSKCMEIDAPAEMRRILADPSAYPMFTSNDDAAILRYTGINPFYNQFGPTGSYDVMSTNTRIGKTLTDLMNYADDPRRQYYAQAKGGEYIGIESGMDADYISSVLNISCTYASALSKDDSPSTLMNYAELLFIKAEAAWRGFIPGDAEAIYNEAVTASVRQWCGNSQNVTGLLANPPVKYDGTILQIMQQKYVSQFISGYEAWCDYRRTGMPNMPVGTIMSNHNELGVPTLPTRFVYPAITQSSNATNYHEAVERMGGKDDMLTKVWWAQGTRY